MIVASLAAGLVLGVGASGPAQAPPRLLVGVADDTLKWTHQTHRVVSVHRDLGLDAVRITIPWRPGERRVRGDAAVYVDRAVRASRLGVRVIAAIYGGPRDAPQTPRARADYCSFAADFLRRAPRVRDVVIWNEVNSPTFWRPQPGAARPYAALLARCWDVLHAARPGVNVITSTAARHDPTGFVRALGSIYRESGRTRPIFDTFGHHPYPETSAEHPWVAHPASTSISMGDYDRLVGELTGAFGGTAQPVPGTPGATIWYLEHGFQTVVPPSKRGHYSGSENDRYALPDADVQGERIRDALFLAYCQPAVSAYFNFELVDEWRLAGWQSGVLWADGTRKRSYRAFKQAIAAVRRGAVDCSTPALRAAA